MRKITFQIILIILFVSLSSYSQSHTISLTEYGYYKTITYFPLKSNPTSTAIAFNNNNTFVGTHFLQEPNENPPYERDMIERTKAGTYLGTSNLNLAPNEIIDVAKLVVTTSSTSGSGNFNIKFIGNSTSGPDADDFWLECNSGSYLGSRPYSSGGNITVTDIVKNNIGNEVWFGFYEGGNGSAKLSVELQIWTSFVPQVDITAQNNFTGGSIKVGVNTSATSRTSPFPFTAYPGNSINLEAVEQSNGGYFRLWNDTVAPNNISDWDRNGEPRSDYQAYSFTATESDSNKTYTANLRKLCNQSFTNNFVGISYKGNVTVNGSSHSAPTTDFGIVELNSISFSSAYFLTYNYIDYYFNNWNDGNTSNSRTINPDSHYGFVANYTGKASNSNRDLHFNTTDPVGTPVKVMWNQHPNSNVTKYEIWRKIGFNVTATPYKIATISRTSASTFTYTDYDIGLERTGSKDDEVSYCKASDGIGQNE